MDKEFFDDRVVPLLVGLWEKHSGLMGVVANHKTRRNKRMLFLTLYFVSACLLIYFLISARKEIRWDIFYGGMLLVFLVGFFSVVTICQMFSDKFNLDQFLADCELFRKEFVVDSVPVHLTQQDLSRLVQERLVFISGRIIYYKRNGNLHELKLRLKTFKEAQRAFSRFGLVDDSEERCHLDFDSRAWRTYYSPESGGAPELQA